jgi:hypothetical protein
LRTMQLQPPQRESIWGSVPCMTANADCGGCREAIKEVLRGEFDSVEGRSRRRKPAREGRYTPMALSKESVLSEAAGSLNSGPPTFLPQDSDTLFQPNISVC